MKSACGFGTHPQKNKGEIIWTWLVGKCTYSNSHTITHCKKKTLPVNWCDWNFIPIVFQHTSGTYPRPPPGPTVYVSEFLNHLGVISGMFGVSFKGLAWGSLRFMEIPPSSHIHNPHVGKKLTSNTEMAQQTVARGHLVVGLSSAVMVGFQVKDKWQVCYVPVYPNRMHGTGKNHIYPIFCWCLYRVNASQYTMNWFHGY